MSKRHYWDNVCTNPYAHDELGVCGEMEPPFPSDPDHPTSSHLLQVGYREHKQFDIDIRRQWDEDNKDTWNL